MKESIFVLLPLVILSHCSGFESNKWTSDNFAVHCGRGFLAVVVNRDILGEIDIQRAHLIDPSCTVVANRTHFIASTVHNGCGTIQRAQKEGSIYTNALVVKDTPLRAGDSDCPIMRLYFSCLYLDGVGRSSQRANVVDKDIQCDTSVAASPSLENTVDGVEEPRTNLTANKSNTSSTMTIGVSMPNVAIGIEESVLSTEYVVKRPTRLYKTVKRNGDHRLEIKLYSDSSFSKLITGEFASKKDTMDIFYDIKFPLNDTGLEISMATCYATPDEDPGNKIAYYIVKNGCVLDGTVQFYQSEPRQVRFSIESFMFTGQRNTKIFMHCKVNICEMDDEYSKCRQGCRQDVNNRSRRQSRKKTKKHLKKKDISSACIRGKLQVTLPKNSFTDISANRVHLNDPSCRATENKTHFVIKHPVGRCGSIRSFEGSNVVYKNKIHLKGVKKYQDLFPMVVRCTYSTQGAKELASTRFRMSNPRRFLFIKNLHPHRLYFKIVLGQEIAQRFVKMPLNIDAKLYGEVLNIMTTTKTNDVRLQVQHCTLKHSLHTRKRIMLIRHGCPSSKRVLFYQHGDHEENIRIRIDPTLTVQRKMAHLTCTIRVCNMEDNRCDKRCAGDLLNSGKKSILSRKRRANEPIDMTISCGQKSMKVTLRKDTLPPVEAVNLRLRDPSCRALENETHFTISTPLGGCGTEVVQDRDALIYTNEIKQDVPGLVIVRRKLVYIPFRCLYHAKASASSTEFRLKAPTILFGGSAKGVYEVKIKMYNDATYTKEKNSVVALVGPEQDMFFEIAMAITEPRLAIMLDQCYGKPTGSTNKRERYVFIRDGCPVDDTVKIYKSPSFDKARFSIKPFQFSHKPVKSIYVTCAVSACNPNDPQAKCFKGCDF